MSICKARTIFRADELIESIYRLFEFTNNSQSKKQLQHILGVKCLRKDEILERQNILKGYLSNWRWLKSYAYSKSELYEVKDFTRRLYLSDWITIGDKGRFRIKWIRSPKSRQTIHTGMKQMVLFFAHLQIRYFAVLDYQSFPAHYREKLKGISCFLNRFPLEIYSVLIREGDFKSKHVFLLLKIFYNLIKDNEFDAFWEDFHLFEAWLSIATGIEKYALTFPEFSSDLFCIDHFYHPFLSNPIKNSIDFSTRLIILTGSNMSGKSTLLKTIGLCVYLAHLGLPVPAERCLLPFFNFISTGLQIEDNIERGQSRFMAELKHLSIVAKALNEGKLVFALFDELFNSTTIEDALDIAIATIQGLALKTAFYGMISTHLHALKHRLPNANIQFAHMACSFDPKQQSLDFHYRLEPGWSDLRLGRILFDKEGLNDLFG